MAGVKEMTPAPKRNLVTFYEDDMLPVLLRILQRYFELEEAGIA
jgi:hypothetical protein